MLFPVKHVSVRVKYRVSDTPTDRRCGVIVVADLNIATVYDAEPSAPTEKSRSLGSSGSIMSAHNPVGALSREGAAERVRFRQIASANGPQ